jgi:hypothetical protein
MSKFVKTGTHRLTLADGSWVDVRAQLGIGAQKRLESSLFGGVRGATEMMNAGREVTVKEVEMRMDLSGSFMLRLELYIVDWSFCDDDDKRVPVTKDNIAILEPQVAEEITELLNKYLDEREAERKTDPTRAGLKVVSKS